MSLSAVIDSIRRKKPRRLAIIGVAKNCGKTTTFNALARALDDLPLGMVSVGIDGESEDMLIGTFKPSVPIHQGQWIASAKSALVSSSARFVYLDDLGFSTPMGSVHIARARASGEVVLAGIRHAADLMEVLVRMEGLMDPGGLILIDGAYGRTIAASSHISDAVIVSTGAVLSSSIRRIVEETVDKIERLLLPSLSLAWHRALFSEAMARGRALLGGQNGEMRALSSPSALLALSRDREGWDETVGAIAIPGLVTDGILDALLTHATVDATGLPRTLIVRDGTVLHTSSSRLRRFRKRGWGLLVSKEISVLGVSINPTSPTGAQVDAIALRDALSRSLPEGLVLFDPTRGLAATPAP